MDSSEFIDNDKQKYQFLDLSKYQGIDKTELNVFYLIDQYY